jgi:hypothetical protein
MSISLRGPLPSMPNERKPRIALNPLALRALKIWSAIEDKDPGDLASELIMNHMPARVRDALGDLDPKPSEPPRRAAIDSTGPDVSPKRKKLAENQTALTKIKELWKAGEHNQAEIARVIGYHRATVNDNIKRMRESGELVD